NDDNEELLILPHGEYQVNVAQYIYEMIVLSVPAKRIHTGVRDGSIDISNYEKYITYEQPKEETISEEIDPRWEKLKSLLNKDDNEELLILPHGEYQVNVAQYIYEMIVLSVPAKRIHTGVRDGSIDISNYEKYITYEQPKEETISEEIDPRWEKLKSLLNKDNK